MTPERSPGFEENLMGAARFLGTHPAIPEDRQEPKPVVTFRCPECGLSQDVAVCKCGEPLCEKCDPDPEAHVRCLQPERKMPYDLLVDARLCLLRVRLAIRRGDHKLALQAAQHFDTILEQKGIA